MNDSTISATEAGRIIGVHRTEVSRLSQKGGVLEHALVEAGRGRRPAAYSRRAIEVYAAALREQRPLDPQHERARKDRAAADRAEFKLQCERNEYLPRDAVEQQLVAQNTAVKNKLLSWAMTLSDEADRASKRDGVAGVERVHSRAVREVLAELADPEPPILCPHCGADMAQDPEDQTCRARTSKGDRCRNAAGDDGYCHIKSHAPEADR